MIPNDRLQLIVELALKKADAAIHHRPAPHFRVYAPEKAREPESLTAPHIAQRMKNLTWWVRWHDGRTDGLSFPELLAFIHQILAVKAAYEASQHELPTEPNGTTRIEAEYRPAVPDDLLADATVRRLISSIIIEPAGLPTEMLN